MLDRRKRRKMGCMVKFKFARDAFSCRKVAQLENKSYLYSLKIGNLYRVYVLAANSQVPAEIGI